MKKPELFKSFHPYGANGIIMLPDGQSRICKTCGRLIEIFVPFKANQDSSLRVVVCTFCSDDWYRENQKEH